MWNSSTTEAAARPSRCSPAAGRRRHVERSAGTIGAYAKVRRSALSRPQMTGRQRAVWYVKADSKIAASRTRPDDKTVAFSGPARPNLILPHVLKAGRLEGQAARR